MDVTAPQSSLSRLGLTLLIPALLAGCLMGEESEPDPALADEVDVQLVGSVGDGPIVGAAMRVLANDGTLLAELQSSSTADYDISIRTKGKNYPLSIDARDGTDIVTSLPPDFQLRGAVLEPSKRAVANVNPYSTMAVEIAIDMSGGASKTNIQMAEGIAVAQLNFGLSSLVSTGPMTTEIDNSNIAEIVRASEALGELIRRTRTWLSAAGVSASGDRIMQALGSDLIDEVIDGRGGPRADARIAAIASVVAAQIALETMANELHVNGVDGTAALSSAIRLVSSGSPQSLDELTATPQALYQARIGIAAAANATGDPALEGLLATSMGLQAGLDASLVGNLLPGDYRQTLDNALTLIATGNGSTLEDVNATVRSGDITAGANLPPTINGTPPASVQAGNSYSFAPTASDPDGDPITFMGSGLPSWLSVNGSTGVLSGTPAGSDVGSYTGLAITVSDGLESATLGPFSITVTSAPIVNSPPTISGTPPASVNANSPYSFTPTASDPDGDVLTFTAANLPGWANLNGSTGGIAGMPGDADVGSYSSITITVSDGSASAMLGPFSITVNGGAATNNPPTISGSPATTVQADSAYSFTPAASDPDGDPLTFSVQGLPSWATFNSGNGRISGIPGIGDVNTYSGIVITVSDGSASASLGPFSITVEALATGSVTLNWTPPTENTDGTSLTDLAGFRIYWGQNGSYPNSVTINNPGVTTYVVDSVPTGTWDFVSTAFNNQGVESGYSNVATKVVQ